VELAQDRVQGRALMLVVLNFWFCYHSVRCHKMYTKWNKCSDSKNNNVYVW